MGSTGLLICAAVAWVGQTLAYADGDNYFANTKKGRAAWKRAHKTTDALDADVWNYLSEKGNEGASVTDIVIKLCGNYEPLMAILVEHRLKNAQRFECCGSRNVDDALIFRNKGAS